VFDFLESFYNPCADMSHGCNNPLSPIQYEKQYFERLSGVQEIGGDSQCLKPLMRKKAATRNR
jgi:hypothetical protein